MEDLLIIALALYTIIMVGFIMNMIQLLSDSKKLRAEGKTPLMNRNILTIGVATVAELVAVFLVTLAASALGFEATILSVLSLFLLGYLSRNGAAYLAAWGLWTLFIRKDKKKMQNKIEEEQEGAF